MDLKRSELGTAVDRKSGPVHYDTSKEDITELRCLNNERYSYRFVFLYILMQGFYLRLASEIILKLKFLIFAKIPKNLIKIQSIEE
jgi:hypothetical protein